MSDIKDFLDQTLNVGDFIVYAGSQGSSGAHLTAGVIVTITERPEYVGSRKMVPIIKVTRTRSRYDKTPDRKPVTLTRFDTIVKIIG